MTGTKHSEIELAKTYRRTAVQGWVSLVVWISTGLLLESLMAFKSPAYLDDSIRRELFRLAHAHGTLLGVVLVIAAMWVQVNGVTLTRPAIAALRVGSMVMPVGFLLAGLVHPESDPGIAIWLVPIGALMLIFGVVSIVLASRIRA